MRQAKSSKSVRPTSKPRPMWTKLAYGIECALNNATQEELVQHLQRKKLVQYIYQILTNVEMQTPPQIICAKSRFTVFWENVLVFFTPDSIEIEGRQDTRIVINRALQKPSPNEVSRLISEMLRLPETKSGQK